MNETGAEAGARAGTGTTPEPSVAKPAPTNSTASRRRRPREIVLEHADVTGPEFTTRRSFSIQDGIERFLEENMETSWRTLDELWIRAANAVWHYGYLKRRPSYVTARRWIQQYTAVGEKYGLREVQGEGYWILERRGNGGNGR